MNILINALSVDNPSGRHVFLGHFLRVIEKSRGRHEFTIIYRSGNSDLRKELPIEVKWLQVWNGTAHWAGRSIWERVRMHHIIKSRDIDLYFSPSGIGLPRMPCRQLILAQNPWCLVKDAPRSCSERIKAWFQRVAYRNTMKNADVIAFVSGYLQRAYQENACGDGSAHAQVVYTGIDDSHIDTSNDVSTSKERNAGSILCVSVYAPHKNVEAVIAVLNMLVRKSIPDVHLVLAGGWSDGLYREKIESLIDELHLTNHVFISGFLNREDLENLYAKSLVFCLMSRCESFGIPAVEAQAFGVPIVTSNCCAVPEICGDGGAFFNPDDILGASNMVERLLMDQTLWEKRSEKSRENVKRFQWERCSGDLLALIDRLEPEQEMLGP